MFGSLMRIFHLHFTIGKNRDVCPIWLEALEFVLKFRGMTWKKEHSFQKIDLAQTEAQAQTRKLRVQHHATTSRCTWRWKGWQVWKQHLPLPWIYTDTSWYIILLPFLAFSSRKQSHGCSINGAASRIGLATARPPEPGAVAPGPKPFPPSWNRVSMPHGAISSALPIRFRTAYDQSQGCSLWFFGGDSTSICTSQCRSKAWSNKSANPNCRDSGNSTSLCQLRFRLFGSSDFPIFIPSKDARATSAHKTNGSPRQEFWTNQPQVNFFFQIWARIDAKLSRKIRAVAGSTGDSSLHNFGA